MESKVNDLIASFEKGALSRREFAAAIMMLAFASGSASRASAATAAPAGRPFNVMGLNHCHINCEDLERSVAFYQKVLGVPVVQTQTDKKIIHVGLGSHGQQMELHQAGYDINGKYVGNVIPRGLDHIAIGIDHWNLKTIDSYIRSQGLIPRDIFGFPSGPQGGDHFQDPDGILIQLMQVAT